MEKASKPHMIACGILQKEIDRLLELGEIDVAVHYLSKGLHTDYKRLQKALSGALIKRLPKAPAGIVVVYGDVCLGFNGEMQALVEKHGVVKVDGLNCIDCLLGGKGRLLEIDPEHKMLFLNPAFIHFMDKIWDRPREEIMNMFSVLDGIVLVDALGDLNVYRDRIDTISEKTGLPILERENVGLGGLKKVIQDTLERNARLDGGLA
jgi:hypothetical protein